MNGTQNMAPPLPQIESNQELTLAVYMHHSLNPANSDTNQNGERLAELGEQVLNLVITNYLFEKKEVLNIALNAQTIRDKRDFYLGRDETILKWLDLYRLKTKLRVAASNIDIMNNSKEMKRYFFTYVGAAFICHDLPTIQDWITRLIDPNAGSSSASHNSDYTSTSQSITSTPDMPPGYITHNSTDVPPYSSSTSPNSTTSANSRINTSLITLALVNEAAAKRRVTIEYPPVKEGLDHMPSWTVRCVIDGQERGIGKAPSQKVAKLEAAQKAYLNMGWS
ncbi:hypothetical protein FB446DRAFT_787768 [Lentinula raphanica]|nr:hypothetical protein FB446DRAFT_787768 [Lentinula raphanica]